MSRSVGIDLGTTNSAVAVFDPAKGDVVPRVLSNLEGKAVTPSVVAFRGAECTVGDTAKEMQAAREPVAAFFKRSMGEADYFFDSPRGRLTATDLSAEVLGDLKRSAEAALGEAVTRAVITVPAYFKDVERKATIAAGAQAGLDVLQTLNEPTAAAVAYGVKNTHRGGTVLVYDLGGGTFDVTVLEISPEEIRILASDGDNRLGGKDWDEWIAAFAADRFEREHSIDLRDDIEGGLELLHIAEGAKKRLSAKVDHPVTFVHDGRRGSYTLTRDAFEQGTEPLLMRTMDITHAVLKELRLPPSRIDGVLMVGGSTRMPAVPALLQKLFRKPPLHGVDVDTVVAQGAAIIAAQYAEGGRLSARPKPAASGGALAARRVVDVTTHSLGMIAVNADGDRYVNSSILKRNRPVPCAEGRPFMLRTRPGGDNRMEIFLTQGESNDPQDVTYLGMYYADNVPHAPDGHQVIDVQYTYDISGAVQLKGIARHGGELKIEQASLPDDVPERFLKPPAKQRGGPVSVVLAFDLSGSMMGTPLVDAKAAAHRFVDGLDLATASVAIMSVADSVKVNHGLSRKAGDLKASIDSLTIGDVGGGNAGQPFNDILTLFRGTAGSSFAVVLADGMWENQPHAEVQAKLCHAAGIQIAAVGFGHADSKFLSNIASTDDTAILTTQGELASTFGTIAQNLAETGGLGVLNKKPRAS